MVSEDTCSGLLRRYTGLMVGEFIGFKFRKIRAGHSGEKSDMLTAITMLSDRSMTVFISN